MHPAQKSPLKKAFRRGKDTKNYTKIAQIKKITYFFAKTLVYIAIFDYLCPLITRARTNK